MALRNPCFKDQSWSHLREKTVEREREREEQRREEEEEEDGGAKIKPTRYGTLDFCMETHLDYESYKIWHGSLAW